MGNFEENNKSCHNGISNELPHADCYVSSMDDGDCM